MSAYVLPLMFHRVSDPHSQCCPEKFSDYLRYLVRSFPIIGIDDPLPTKGIAITLTFDDAYYDFYHHVFPLLKQYRIPALLAVPVKYIADSTTLPPETRLAVPYPHGMGDHYEQHAPFCTWEELQEMADSSYVRLASHSYSHANLADPATDLEQEISVSKNILEKKLNKTVNYFVYPFGKMTKTVHQKVLQHYRYGIRIGSALNSQWDPTRGQLYRIDADFLWKHHRPIDRALIRKLQYKYWMNRIRGK
jgi:peptidoglycan/xylan/chitin deacetylase (PgdA/CDA1 family)